MNGKSVHAHHEVATPIPCKLDQRVPKSQINTRVSKKYSASTIQNQKNDCKYENNRKSITNEIVVSV